MLRIKKEHPDYAEKKALWRKYRHLYAGGEEFAKNAEDYLIKRHREPQDIYAERVSRVFYENYVGSIIDWYAATLFRREPLVTCEGPNNAGREFFASFCEDCDRKGTALSDFFRRQVTQALLTGSSFTLVDFPRVKQMVRTRAEEDATGASRAYLVGCNPEQVTNWGYDEQGNYEWVVIRTASEESRPGLEGPSEVRWQYYDKENFRIFRADGRAGGACELELVDEGRHGLAGRRQVPLFEMRVSEGLWLMNKAALLQLEHFNKSNALSWALTMGLFAMPVVYSDRPFQQMVGESYFVQLGPEDKFSWAEPEGHIHQLAAENLVRLKDEIYRVCYLITQAGGGLNGGVAQSGLSKQRDYAITQEVLRAYGDMVKDTMKRVIRAIEGARQDGLAIDVSGLDEFDIGDFSSELEDARKLLELGAGSRTLRKQVLKKLALKYLCDVRQHTKDQIAKEIDESSDANA